MMARAALIVAMIGLAGLSSRLAPDTEVLAARHPLANLPLTIGSWTGVDAQPFADDVVRQLGVDDHINRRYSAEGAVPLGLYVGYYASQRQGDSIHSPQNCLPGGGWHPVESGRQSIQAPASRVDVNRYVVQKGLDRLVVLYWYQGRGRIVANEYVNKGWLLFDAARLHRTSGGLVRIIAPVVAEGDDGEAAATSAASSFASAVLTHLEGYLP